MDQIYKIGAIILKDKKLLVVRKRIEGRTEYIIPGGRPERGEKHEDTLRRELQEELKVKLKSYRSFGSFSEIAVFENVPINMEVYFTEIEGTPIADSEIKEFVWIDSNYSQKGIALGSVLGKFVIPKLISDGLM